MKTQYLVLVAALFSLALAPFELHRIHREVEEYQDQIDDWRANGAAYLSIPIYLGIDSAEILIREVRGGLERPRESELKRLLAELRPLMKNLEIEIKIARPFEVDSDKTIILLSGRNVHLPALEQEPAPAHSGAVAQTELL